MKTRIYVPDIECDSCVRLIDKKLKSLESVHKLHVHPDSVEVEYDEAHTNSGQLVDLIKGCGFRASLHPFERKTFKERWRDFKENKTKYKIEVTGLKYVFYTFLILVALQAIAYFGFLQNIPDFLVNYGWWFFYLTISVVAIGLGIWHVYAYEAKVTCMVGMMIGMTIGMQSGMMLGAIIGATNGFFVGAMAGMLIGVAVGSLTGKCCGVMGVMEGMMAGIMGGTMGPMISVMMFSDHLLWFMPFYMLFNIIILLGLSYMLFEEVVEHRKVVKKPIDFLTFASVCIIVTFLLAALMIYGPKSPLISF